MKLKALVSVLLLSAMLFCACSQIQSSDQTSEATSPDTKPETPWAERASVSDELPESDFDGYTFTFYLRSDAGLCEDFNIAEESGDIVDDAVFRRNRTIEERFDVKISFNYDDSGNTTYQTTAVNSILANEDVNDVLALHGAFAFVYAKEGYVLDWKSSLPYVNLEKPWWDSDFSDNMDIAGKLFAMTGDISHKSIGATFCMVFNKELFDRYLLEYPYQTVTDGNWTLERFGELVKTCSIDLDGNGLISADADLYGISMGIWNIPVQIFYSAGDRVITIDENGVPSLTVYNDRTVDIFTKFFNIVEGGNCYINGVSPAYDGDIFREGRALFAGASMGSLVSLRDMDSPIGIIPAPKYQESTEKYYSLVDAGQNVFCVPVTASDLDRTSILLEAYAAEGYKTIVPVFFEEALQVKYSRDDESAAMLEIIRGGRIFDYGYYDATISWDLSYIGRNLAEPANRNFTSYYKSREKLAQKNLEKLYEQYLNS